MENIFSSIPKTFGGKPLTAFGSKHPEYRLAIDCMSNRQEDGGLFIVEGLWAYEKISARKVEVVHFLFCPEYIKTDRDQAAVGEFIRLAGSAGYLSAALCARLSDRDETEGFFAVCRYPDWSVSDVKLAANNIILVLDGLEKPGNIGTIIRTAEGAGADAVISVGGKVRLTHNRLIAASLGASLTMPVFAMELGDCLGWLRENGFTAYLTLLDGEHFYHESGLYEGRVAIVGGNEIRGISDTWRGRPIPTVGIRIPMFGDCDSLNVGFAETIVAYEASLRQKGLVKR